MKKYAQVLVLLLLIGLTAGCLGGNGSASPTPSEPTSAEPPSTTTTEVSTTTTHSPTETPKEITTDELLVKVSEINQFTYTASGEISMLVIIEQTNLTQKDNITLEIEETGYMDFESQQAWINTTTRSIPDGASTNTSKIVINNVTYIQTPLGWVKSSDPATVDFIWRYNVVSLAKEYLETPPAEKSSGETLVLKYYLDKEEVLPLAMMYFAATPDTEVSVQNGVLELYFRDSHLIGGRITFSVRTETSIDDPTIGKMMIIQEGSWSESITVTSTNEKRNVEPPI